MTFYRPLLLSAVVALCATLSAPAVAQWKWRDKSGHITVSDLPPPRDISDKDVLQRPNQAVSRATTAPASAAPAAAPASAPAMQARVDPELEARRKRTEQEQDTKRKQDEERVAAQRAENCRRAQDFQRTLDSGQRITRTNDKGEREFLDDAQRAEEQRRTRDAITANCR